jgi:hypothetical protein
MYINKNTYVFFAFKARKEREFAEEQEKQDQLERDKVLVFHLVVTSIVLFVPFLYLCLFWLVYILHEIIFGFCCVILLK